jgi:hypothetical protein
MGLRALMAHGNLCMHLAHIRIAKIYEREERKYIIHEYCLPSKDR